jgi:chorismate synthase
MKYRVEDARDILERASARETAVRTAVGAVCRQFLGHFGIIFQSHVRQIGLVRVTVPSEEILKKYDRVEKSEVRAFEKTAEMVRDIQQAADSKDSIGGVVEVIITGCPPGLGSHVSWDRKLDANLARAILSIQAVKGCEFGEGFHTAELPGSEVHDEIFHSAQKGFYRKTNRAGGIEGGMSNGNPIVIRAVMKPIPTLMKPLMSVDLKTKKSERTFKERSDVCAVPAFSIVAENISAIEICREFLAKFGGDSMDEIRERFG